MKQIIYTANDYGVDGGGKRHIVKASYDEKEISEFISSSRNRLYLRAQEEIVHVEEATAAALNKLSGIDKLLLGV